MNGGAGGRPLSCTEIIEADDSDVGDGGDNDEGMVMVQETNTSLLVLKNMNTVL